MTVPALKIDLHAQQWVSFDHLPTKVGPLSLLCGKIESFIACAGVLQAVIVCSKHAAYSATLI